jgi:hypothetical protein
MTPVAPTRSAVHHLIRFIPEDANQARRMVAYLAEHPNATTQQVAASCSIGNLSDVARKVNPYLYPQGYMISCQRPPAAIPNRFGEPSGMWLWGLYQVQAAANDDDYGIGGGAGNVSS